MPFADKLDYGENREHSYPTLPADREDIVAFLQRSIDAELSGFGERDAAHNGLKNLDADAKAAKGKKDDRRARLAAAGLDPDDIPETITEPDPIGMAQAMTVPREPYKAWLDYWNVADANQLLDELRFEHEGAALYVAEVKAAAEWIEAGGDTPESRAAVVEKGVNGDG